MTLWKAYDVSSHNPPGNRDREASMLFEASDRPLFLEDAWYAAALQGHEILGQHDRIKADE